MTELFKNYAITVLEGRPCNVSKLTQLIPSTFLSNTCLPDLFIISEIIIGRQFHSKVASKCLHNQLSWVYGHRIFCRLVSSAVLLGTFTQSLADPKNRMALRSKYRQANKSYAIIIGYDNLSLIWIRKKNIGKRLSFLGFYSILRSCCILLSSE